MNSEISMAGRSIISYSISSAGSIFGLMIYMLIVPILIFFFLYDKEQIHGWFRKFFPEKLDLSKKAYAELDLKIGNYIRCKLIEIIIVWIASTLWTPPCSSITRSAGVDSPLSCTAFTDISMSCSLPLIASRMRFSSASSEHQPK